MPVKADLDWHLIRRWYPAVEYRPGADHGVQAGRDHAELVRRTVGRFCEHPSCGRRRQCDGDGYQLRAFSFRHLGRWAGERRPTTYYGTTLLRPKAGSSPISDT